jgi:hypothetical protein
MAKITKSHDSVLDLTVFNVEGEATFDELWDQTYTFLSGKPSKFAIWDFTSGTVALMSSREVIEIATRTSKFFAKIEGGQGALVAPNDIDYGMTRMFQVFSKMKNFPFRIQVFRDRNTAEKWLFPGQ